MAVEYTLYLKFIGALKYLKKPFAWAKEQFAFWFNLKKKIKELEAREPERQISPNARFCPNCDSRMILGSVSGDGNWFKCPACKAVQWYKTKH